MVFSFFGGSKPTLIQTGPGGKNRSFTLEKPETTIGRAPNADIVIDDPYLAPIHARIERQPDGGFVIRRMGLNPIVLRGETLMQTASMKPGDSFRLGKDVEFQYVVKGAAKAPAKDDDKSGTQDGEKKPAKPLLKRPAFLAAMGLVYLGAIGAVVLSIFSGGSSEDDGPSAARINAEAAGIADCIKSARRMRAVSEASFNGAVSGRASGEAATYAALAASPEPSDDAALAKAVEPIAEAYRKASLAGLASEVRGNAALARSLYQKAFDAVPDINCSAGRFAMQRRAATEPATEE